VYPVASHEALLIATTNLKSQIEKAGAEIITGDLPRLIANPGHLIQIFQNLIGNSLKYRGASPPRIIVAAVKSENRLIFSVKDNGIGIGSDYHEKIFTSGRIYFTGTRAHTPRTRLAARLRPYTG
jgi:light-regulated signal transduction histidine kinase (bacteriophytochrome)